MFDGPLNRIGPLNRMDPYSWNGPQNFRWTTKSPGRTIKLWIGPLRFRRTNKGVRGLSPTFSAKIEAPKHIIIIIIILLRLQMSPRASASATPTPSSALAFLRGPGLFSLAPRPSEPLLCLCRAGSFEPTTISDVDENQQE